jgi:Tol biopolymer transport system component
MRKTTVSIVIVFTALIASAGLWSQSAEDLFQKALTLEREVGNLQEAIGLYEKAVETSRGQVLAARAQLRIGICYEKLGMQQAQKAFQKVIDNYPLQLDEVREAKERISRLARTPGEVPGKPKFRKIQIPANPGNGVSSPDGKRLAFESEGSIWVVPIPGNVDPDVAGTPVRLTEPIGATNSGNTLAWSGNGQWIAFNTYRSAPADPNSIFVVPSDGGEVKKVAVQPAGDNPSARFLSLSRDGKTVAFRGDKGIFITSVDGGEAKPLFDIDNNEFFYWSGAVFSPDGKKLVFATASRKENRWNYESSLWVVDSVGGPPVKLYSTSGLAAGPMWSPDGEMIAFIHSPSGMQGGSRKLCIIPAKGPVSAANGPLVIDLPLQPYHIPAGWTAQNSIGLLMRDPGGAAVYTVPSSGGLATQVSPAGVLRRSPEWSPDAGRIFYGGYGIQSIPAAGGAVETILADDSENFYEAPVGGGNNISADGKKLVFSGVRHIGGKGDEDDRTDWNIYTIPAGGGQPAQVTFFSGYSGDTDVRQAAFPCWSPDGKWVAFILYQKNEKGNFVNDIFIVPADGGEPRRITSESHRTAWAGIDWSPDGGYIAYFSLDKSVNLLPLDGADVRTLAAVDEIRGAASDVSYSPDGKTIVFSDKRKIYAVPVEGGPAVEVKTGLEEAMSPSWSPNGKTIAFTAVIRHDFELYLVEDFLPLLKTGRK